MRKFIPNARILELPTLGPVCCLLNYDTEADDWRVEIHFYHPDIAPSCVALCYPDEASAVFLLEGMAPDVAESILQQHVSNLLGWGQA